MTEDAIRDMTVSRQRGLGANGSAPDRRFALMFMRSVSQDPEFPRLASAMLERDYEVVLVAHEDRRRAHAALMDLSARYPRVDHVRTPRRRDPWRILASATRRALDYLNYLDPAGEDRDVLGAEVRERAPRLLRALLHAPPFRWRFGRRMLGSTLRRLEAGLPIAPATKALIRERSPAVVVLSENAACDPEAELVRSAHAARIPSVLVLTGTKRAGPGELRDVPTLTVASSQEQVNDAVRAYRLPRDRIHAVGVEVAEAIPMPSPPGVVDCVDEAARTQDVGNPPGRLLRPMLWVLSPLVILTLLMLHPIATSKAGVGSIRRLARRLRARRRHGRKGRPERLTAKARSETQPKGVRSSAARERKAARAHEKQRKAKARAAKQQRRREKAGRSQAGTAKPPKAAAKERERTAKSKGKRPKPPIWKRKAVRTRAHAIRRRWKYTRRAVRRVYNRRYRFTYRRTIKRVPARDELPALLNARGLNGRGAEIGVKLGAYSDELLSNWQGEELVSIDPWLSADPEEYVDRSNVSQEEFDRYFEETRNRLRRHGSRSTIWRMTSVEAATKVPDLSFDFVYIDARHDYDSVREDLEAWCAKVRPGGILAGHDYVDGDLPQGEFYVKSAVDEFFGERGIHVHSTEGPTAVEMFPTWIVEVPEEGIGPSLTRDSGEAIARAEDATRHSPV